MTTQAERDHMGKVAALGCLIPDCGAPAHVHHIRDGQGLGQRASNFLTIPLCPDHHMGALSIHKASRQFQKIYGDELQLLAKTIEALGGD